MELDATKGMRVMSAGDTRPAPVAPVGQVATAEQAQAAIASHWLAEVMIVCAECNVIYRGVYIGETREIRSAAAKEWVLRNEGWESDPETGNRCPACIRVDVFRTWTIVRGVSTRYAEKELLKDARSEAYPATLTDVQYEWTGRPSLDMRVPAEGRAKLQPRDRVCFLTAKRVVAQPDGQER